MVWGQGPQIEVTGPGMGPRVLCGGQGSQDGPQVPVGGSGLGSSFPPPPPTHRLITAASRSCPRGPGRGGRREPPPHPSSRITGSRQVVRIHSSTGTGWRGGRRWRMSHGTPGWGLGGLTLGHRRDEGGLHQPLQVLTAGDGRHRGHEGAGHVPQCTALLWGGGNNRSGGREGGKCDPQPPPAHTHTHTHTDAQREGLARSVLVCMSSLAHKLPCMPSTAVHELLCTQTALHAQHQCAQPPWHQCVTSHVHRPLAHLPPGCKPP